MRHSTLNEERKDDIPVTDNNTAARRADGFIATREAFQASNF
jgi:hypothetical protein